MSGNLGRLVAPIRTGAEPFHAAGEALGCSLLDFWRWSGSDLVSNTTRGLVAEFLVARALGGPAAPVREEWATYDVISPEGIRVEVKSAAYLQAWHQRRLSRITFCIRQTQGWNAETGQYEREVRRQADVYVFALLAHQEKATLDPLNVDQWQFFALAAATLNERLGARKSISLASLKQLCSPVAFHDLADAVRSEARLRPRNCETEMSRRR